MPDAWERERGMNPNVANNNGDDDTDGYTDVEEYLNDVASFPAPRPIVFSATTSNRYALQRNWDIDWQPSRLDTAQINAGTVVVDATGQEALNLQIGASPGSGATLQISFGRLVVGNNLDVGLLVSSSGATLALSGGKLVVGGELRGGAGAGEQLHLTGGTLVANAINASQFGGTILNTGSTLSPGDSDRAGRTSVIGNYSAGAGSSIRIELGGATAATTFQSATPAFDRLNVSGNASLAGELQLVVIDAYVPMALDEHEVISAASVTGVFGSITGHQYSADRWLAVTYTATRVLVTSTVPGDVDVDGEVSFADLLALAQNYETAGVMTWSRGDFTGDGATNFGDLLVLAQRYGAGVTGSLAGDWSMAMSLVPEPGAMVWFATAVLLGRRRRGGR
jgi:hypothetical protein